MCADHCKTVYRTACSSDSFHPLTKSIRQTAESKEENRREDYNSFFHTHLVLLDRKRHLQFYLFLYLFWVDLARSAALFFFASHAGSGYAAGRFGVADSE